MPVTIILAASKEVKEKAKKIGFIEETLLIRFDGKPKEKSEHEMFSLGPYQFLVSDYWGAGPD